MHFSIGPSRNTSPFKKKRKPSHKSHQQLSKILTRKDDLHVAQCNTIEKAALKPVVAASGTTDAPNCLRFSAVPRGFSDQFHIGHYNYWRSEDVTHRPEEDPPQS